MAARATYTPTLIRNVALIGHRSAGKTSLAEAILAVSGAVRTAGSVTHGTALLDFDDVERKKQLSLQTGFAWIEWGDDLMQLIDTPGLSALAYERALGIGVSEAVIVVVDAGEEITPAAEIAFAESLQRGVPTLVFVNKLDRPHDLGTVLDALQAAAGERRVIPVEAPVGEGGQCTGVVDLLSGAVDMKEGCEPITVTQSWMARFSEQLTEAIALTDDALLEHYLEYMEVPEERLRAALAKAVGRGEIVPVLFGSATNQYGVRRLLDFVTSFVPSAGTRTGPTAFEYDGTPVELEPSGSFVAQLVATQLDGDGQPFHVLRIWQGEAQPNQVWTNATTGESAKVRKLYKIRGPRRSTAQTLCAGGLVATWDPLPGRPGACFNTRERLYVPAPELPPSMMAYALNPTSDRDARRLQEGLVQLLAMDGSLDVHTDETTGQLLLRGYSDAHLDLALERLRSRLGVAVTAELPPIPYREMPASGVVGVSGIHRKEDNDGLPVEYGACQVDVTPLPPDEGNGFEDAHPDPDELPTKFRPAIDEGVRRALEHGPTAGYPVLGATVRLTGGEYDILQSTEDHFRIAGELAARSALEQAGTRILEPWWQVDVYARGTEVGHVISEISVRRGRIVGLEVLGTETRVCAQMPYRELRTFGPRLQGATSGRGRFYGEFSHYEPAPDHILSEAIADSPFRRAS
ncbi:MAG: GTP-binding protein [Myxococcota bacterium]